MKNKLYYTVLLGVKETYTRTIKKEIRNLTLVSTVSLLRDAVLLGTTADPDLPQGSPLRFLQLRPHSHVELWHAAGGSQLAVSWYVKHCIEAHNVHVNSNCVHVHV